MESNKDLDPTPEELLQLQAEMGGIESDPTPEELAMLGIEPSKSPAISKESPSGILENIDAYTGYPARVALSKGLESKSIPEALKAYKEAIGTKPLPEYTGKEIAARDLGFSKEPGKYVSSDIPGTAGMFYSGPDFESEKTNLISPAGAVGLGIDVLVDPSNIALSKAGIGAMGAVARGTGAAAEKIAKAVTPGVAQEAFKIGSEASKKILKGTAEKAKELLSLISEPKFVENADELVKTAKDIGVDVKNIPDTVLYGKDSVIGTTEQILGQSLATKKAVNTKYKNFIDAIQNATEAEAIKYGIPGEGRKFTALDAGKAIREGINDGMKRELQKFDITNAKIIKDFPDLALSPKALDTITNEAIRLDKLGDELIASKIPDRMVAGQAMKNTSQALMQNDGSYIKAYDQLSGIGRTQEERLSNKLLPKDLKELSSTYSKVREAMTDSIEEGIVGGKEIAAKLRENNKEMSSFLKRMSNISDLKDSDADVIWRETFKKQDPETITKVISLLDENQIKKVKSAFLNELFQKESKAVDPIALQNWFKDNRFVVESLFEPSELSKIDKLATLKASLPASALNPSRSGEFLEATQGGIVAAAKRNLVTQGVSDALKKQSLKGTIPESVQSLRDAYGVKPQQVTPKSPGSVQKLIGDYAKVRSTQLESRIAQKTLQLKSIDEQNKQNEKPKSQEQIKEDFLNNYR